jgi:hypothetical protein
MLPRRAKVGFLLRINVNQSKPNWGIYYIKDEVVLDRTNINETKEGRTT